MRNYRSGMSYISVFKFYVCFVFVGCVDVVCTLALVFVCINFQILSYFALICCVNRTYVVASVFIFVLIFIFDVRFVFIV